MGTDLSSGKSGSCTDAALEGGVGIGELQGAGHLAGALDHELRRNLVLPQLLTILSLPILMAD